MIIKKIFQGWMMLSPPLLCATITVLIDLAGSVKVLFDAIDALEAISWTLMAYCAITLAVLIAMMAQAAKETRMERKIKGEKSDEEEHHAR